MKIFKNGLNEKPRTPGLKFFVVVVNFIRRLPYEAIVWLSGLLALALSSPLKHTHFTICPLALAGFNWCPGCGLGRSISFLFHGHLQQSFLVHPVGILAVIVLSFRITSLIKNYIRFYGKSY